MSLRMNLILDVAKVAPKVAVDLDNAMAVPVQIRTRSCDAIPAGTVTLIDPTTIDPKDGTVKAFSFKTKSLVTVPSKRVALLAD